MTMPFDLRTATPRDMLERAEYLEQFPARGRYRDDLHAVARALRELAKGRASPQARLDAERDRVKRAAADRTAGHSPRCGLSQCAPDCPSHRRSPT